MLYEYSYFKHVRDNRPKLRKQSIEQLRKVFEQPKIVEAKEQAELFCPAKFRLGELRTSQAVEAVSMAVFDMDCGLGWETFVADWCQRGWCFWIYTTFKHTSESPRWRAVFPLKVPVAGSDWAPIWTNLSAEIVGDKADPACKDSGRMYYLPCCAADQQNTFVSHFYEGERLDATAISSPKSPTPVPPPQPKRKLPTSTKASDWFNETATIDSILFPHGWRRTGNQGELELWARPGKDGRDDISATFGFRPTMDGERFYCFSSSVSEIPMRKMLTKFALYAYLNHHGDFKLAGKKLAKEFRQKTEPPREKPRLIIHESDEWFLRQCTDATNGERLVKAFGNQVRYVAELKEWAKWDGARWLIESKAEAALRVMATTTARSTETEARSLANAHQAQKLLSWAIRSQDSNRLSNAIREAQALLTVSISEFDRHPYLLNCKNGMLDLKTGKLLPHDRSLLLSQVTECDYEETDMVPPIFNGFIQKIIPDKGTLSFLLQFLGYSLTGVLSDQSYAFFHGATGNNGKSTLVDLMLWMLGDYAVTLDTESLMITRGFTNPEYELARLRGKRFAVAHEVSDNQRLNEPLIKRLTGGDTIRARRPYGLPFEFRPTAKICMTGNNKPTISGQDSATWRRVNLVPFEVEVPASERNPNLGAKLRDEAPLILNYLVKWCLNYQNNGLIRSESMLQSRDSYREENDFMAEFISSECVFGPAYSVGCSELHQRYIEWARKTVSTPLTPTSFGRIMSQRAVALNISRTRNAAGRKIWNGCDIVGE